MCCLDIRRRLRVEPLECSEERPCAPQPVPQAAADTTQISKNQRVPVMGSAYLAKELGPCKDSYFVTRSHCSDEHSWWGGTESGAGQLPWPICDWNRGGPSRCGGAPYPEPVRTARPARETPTSPGSPRHHPDCANGVPKVFFIQPRGGGSGGARACCICNIEHGLAHAFADAGVSKVRGHVAFATSISACKRAPFAAPGYLPNPPAGQQGRRGASSLPMLTRGSTE